MTPKNPHAVALGKLGGKAGTGPAKARTSAQARSAALIRWQPSLKPLLLSSLKPS